MSCLIEREISCQLSAFRKKPAASLADSLRVDSQDHSDLLILHVLEIDHGRKFSLLFREQGEDAVYFSFIIFLQNLILVFIGGLDVTLVIIQRRMVA